MTRRSLLCLLIGALVLAWLSVAIETTSWEKIVVGSEFVNGREIPAWSTVPAYGFPAAVLLDNPGISPEPRIPFVTQDFFRLRGYLFNVVFYFGLLWACVATLAQRRGS